MRYHKNPGVAVALSFILPVLGQIYCGDFPRGFIFILINFFSGLMRAVRGWISLLIALPVLVVAMVDAYKLARRINASDISKQGSGFPM